MERRRGGRSQEEEEEEEEEEELAVSKNNKNPHYGCGESTYVTLLHLSLYILDIHHVYRFTYTIKLPVNIRHLQ